MLSTLGRFRSAWQHRLDRILPAGSHRRAITFDLLVGILILAAMLGLQWAGMVSASPDWAADALMPYHADTPAHEDRARPFAFIDIDNETYREWGEPLVTPRDKLAELIDFAAEAGAASVIVDIDLSRETKPHEDQKLREVLDAHGAEAQASPPHIILARSFDLGRTEPTSAATSGRARPSSIPSWRPTPTSIGPPRYTTKSGTLPCGAGACGR
jgi:CHASE2 domain-containing sensor protein